VIRAAITRQPSASTPPTTAEATTGTLDCTIATMIASQNTTTSIAIVQSSVPVVASAVVGGVLALGCLVIAARITKPWAYPAGTVLQILAFLSGIVVHTMFVVGAIFAALWWVALRMGNTAAARAEEFADWVAAGRPPRNQGDVSGPPS
jgi:hypothetical protein